MKRFNFWLTNGLRVDILFEKERAAENGGIDFEIWDIGTSAHLYGG